MKNKNEITMRVWEKGGGEGYIRVSVTFPDTRLEEALERIKKVL